MDLLIIGSSGHAKVIIDIVRSEGRHRIVGLLDDMRPVGEETLGIPILGSVADLPMLMERTGAHHGVIAIGDNAGRMEVAARIAEHAPDFNFVSVVHPSAIIGSDVRIMAGTVVMPGVIINASCSIGAHCILNTGASVDHDCTLGDHVSIAPGAVLGGRCRIDSGTAIGMSASILQGIVVGAHCVIGAGAVVIQNVPDLQLAFGIPAKCVRTRQAGERYL